MHGREPVSMSARGSWVKVEVETGGGVSGSGREESSSLREKRLWPEEALKGLKVGEEERGEKNLYRE